MKMQSVLFVSFCLSVFSVFAMNTKAPNEEVEVIEIVGQFSKAQWERIAESAKVDFYDLYNQFNEIEKFRMVCRPTATVGTRIKRQVCEPMYYKHAMYELTQTRLGNGIAFSQAHNADQHVIFLTKETRKEADAHIETLINEHPELRKKFEYFAKAKAASELRATMND